MRTSTAARFPSPHAPLPREELSALDLRRRLLASGLDRSVAVGIALRRLRNAGAITAIFAAIEEVVEHYLRADAYAIVSRAAAGSRVLLARGLDPSQVTALERNSQDPADAPRACCHLGAGEWSLGWLAIYQIRGGAAELDGFDRDLLRALSVQVTVALQNAQMTSDTPTVRLPDRKAG
jgi:hypothetical protein